MSPCVHPWSVPGHYKAFEHRNRALSVCDAPTATAGQGQGASSPAHYYLPPTLVCTLQLFSGSFGAKRRVASKSTRSQLGETFILNRGASEEVVTSYSLNEHCGAARLWAADSPECSFAGPKNEDLVMRWDEHGGEYNRGSCVCAPEYPTVRYCSLKYTYYVGETPVFVRSLPMYSPPQVERAPGGEGKLTPPRRVCKVTLVASSEQPVNEGSVDETPIKRSVTLRGEDIPAPGDLLDQIAAKRLSAGQAPG